MRKRRPKYGSRKNGCAKLVAMFWRGNSDNGKARDSRYCQNMFSRNFSHLFASLLIVCCESIRTVKHGICVASHHFSSSRRRRAGGDMRHSRLFTSIFDSSNQLFVKEVLQFQMAEYFPSRYGDNFQQRWPCKRPATRNFKGCSNLLSAKRGTISQT